MSVRERKEVQEMLRGVEAGARGQGTGARIGITLLLCVPILRAAILPDKIGELQKGAVSTVAVPDQALYDEYGFEAAERADYSAPGKHFTATAWRLHDSTGAMALFQAIRPATAVPSQLAALSVRTPGGAIVAYGNYVLQFEGAYPEGADLEDVYGDLPKLERAPLPTLSAYLPPGGLVPNSERYVLGPVSLQRFEARITPSQAAFHLGTEAQLGTYHTPKGNLTLAIFNFPTPNIARERFQEYQGIPGALAKRSGPLVAVIVQPPDADAAEKVLSEVRYAAILTLSEQHPKDEAKGLASLVLNIFALAGVLVGLSILLGIGFGGFRALARKLGIAGKEPEAMTVLRLGDK